MTLKEYLKEKKITQGEFAERLGVSQTWLSLVMTRKRIANGALALKISEETGGLVPLPDILRGRP